MKNWWGDSLHTVVSHVADGMPAYVVKNLKTGKNKVLHQSQLLLWLADFSEPVHMNRMCTDLVPSVTLLRTKLEDPLQESEDGGLVLGCMQYGLNLAKLQIIVDTPESMTCQIAWEMHTGAPQNGTSLRIEFQVGEEADPQCLGSFMEDVPCS